METAQMITLEKGSGYDMPVQGSAVLFSCDIWKRDENRPNNDYKGGLPAPTTSAAEATSTHLDVVKTFIRELSIGQKIRVHHPNGNV
ncbi:MAG: hypothetical protein M1840_008738 [Geoglossum simile]|nr:MAG: hypothetical protein M1840_008738 [Geoglossum simile]